MGTGSGRLVPLLALGLGVLAYSHDAVCSRLAAADPALVGMGTTITVLLLGVAAGVAYAVSRDVTRDVDFVTDRVRTMAQIRTEPTGELIPARTIDEVGIDNVWFSFGVAHPGQLTLGNFPRFLQEIRRIVTIFRELRNGVTLDGKTKVKVPTGTLSTAEAISVVNNGLAMAAYFGDGQLKAADLAAGIIGAIIKDPVQDKIVWQEYLETVVKPKDDWKDIYRACRDMV